MASSYLCPPKLVLVSMLLLTLALSFLEGSYTRAVQPMLCDAGERSALLQFKESFVIDRFASSDPLAYPKTRSWSLHSDCCSWDGVDCDDEGDGHVIGLDLSSSHLFGSINSNSSLFKLNHLQWLSLSHNHFNYSPIPPELALLSATLTHLNLSTSYFAGQIPQEISMLSRLTVLDLAVNINSSSTRLLQLNKPTFISLVKNMTNLEELFLSWVDISSTVPDIMSNLSSLSKLFLRGCNLVGQFPSTVFLLPNITHISIRYNQDLTGHLPRFSPSPLKHILLRNTSFSGPIPSSLGNLTSLTYLDFSFNNFTVGDLSWLAQLHNLQTLYFDGINISSEIPCSLAGLANLKVLFLRSCHLTGHVPFWISNLPQLTHLDLGYNLLRGSLPSLPPSIIYYSVKYNGLTGEIPSLFCNSSSLLYLELNHNNLSSELPRCMGNMSNLTILTLNNNNFSGTIPQMCRNGNNRMEAMNFAENQLHGKMPTSLANCGLLRIIDVGNNEIIDTFPFWMGRLRGLQLLILRSNRFYGAIVSSASSNDSLFPNLRIIDLSRNGFFGVLPSALFYNWKAMKKSNSVNFKYMQINKNTSLLDPDTLAYSAFSMILANKGSELVYDKIPNELAALDFSSNDFSGEIPKLIGNLNGLHVLNLSNNYLTGRIVPSLANISGIESLDLSNNKLSGEIPQELAQLNFLEILNVSHNNLTGQVPRGKQFDTFQDNSFDGNLGLCGELLINDRCKGHAPPSIVLICSENCEDVESSFPEKWDWIMITAGYGGGLIVGFVVGNALMAKKPEWFVKVFGKKMKPQTRRGTRSPKN